MSSPIRTKLPDGFVELKDIDPSIKQIVRYATEENFVGRVVPGYSADNARIVCTLKCAEALKLVQNEVLKDGYCLVVYDAYRPQKAVNYFLEWSEDVREDQRKRQYFPYVPKDKVFELGYVAGRSGHTRGSTVDLTLIETDKEPFANISFSVRRYPNDPERHIPYLDDGTIDMGSSFDLLDEASHHDSNLIPEEYLRRRNYLKNAMTKFGFREYDQEWWHYSLKDEPFPSTYFDFDV